MTKADEILEQVKVTKGMANALKGDKKCPGCDMQIPSYPGRYPAKCPECGAELK